MAKLKVYRTPIGFHDAYVAAPSQKAALAAWGTTHNLFTRGVADIVTDPALMEAPLATPGVVVKRSRGTAAEQLAALPPGKRAESAKRRPRAGGAAAAPRAPRPDRHQLDLAERAIERLQSAHEQALAILTDRISQLERERAALVRAHGRSLTKLETVRAHAAELFDKAVERWRG